jgi:hypothetical protein
LVEKFSGMPAIDLLFKSTLFVHMFNKSFCMAVKTCSSIAVEDIPGEGKKSRGFVLRRRLY